MAKKGKEIDIGGWRIQIDPVVLAQRILMRQKKLLTWIAILGGIATIAFYKTTKKQYTSHAEILIRSENFSDDYLRKLLNVVSRYVGSDTEMMIIINELNLYQKMRATLPYDLALRAMSRELQILRPTGSLHISFKSRSPQEAQRVVAFVTERMITKLEDLKDSPFRRELEAIDRAIEDVEPMTRAAQLKLFEFKALHPDIAIRTEGLLIQPDSPAASLEEEIKRAEQDLARARLGAPPVSTTPTKKDTAPRRRLRELESERDQLLTSFTPNHPSVLELDERIRKQKALVSKDDEERGEATIAPGATQAQLVEAATSRLRRLHERRIDLEKVAIRKPKLQGEWAELSLETAQRESQIRGLKDRRAQVVSGRFLSANEFQENFQLVDVPRVPELPSDPDRNQSLATGMAVTFILGMLLASIREALRQTFVDAQEFADQTGLQVLAVLPSANDRTSS